MLREFNKFPNFLIIGAAKSGTTSLADYLNQHPQIYISPFKEPCFFAYENQRVNFQGPGDPPHEVHFTELERYKSLFDNVTDEIAIGEASTSYLCTPKTAERIWCYIPDVKLIAVLRNPVDRAYSSFLHLVRDGRETCKSFEEALAKEEQRILNNWADLWRYQKNGLYYEQLTDYYKIFRSEQIKIFLYDDFQENTNLVLKEIFNFLEVDPDISIDTSVKHNVSGVPRSRVLYNLLNTQNPIRNTIGKVYRLLPLRVRSYVRKGSLEKPKLLAETRTKLSKNYQDDIIKLQDFIQRDLSNWIC